MRLTPLLLVVSLFSAGPSLAQETTTLKFGLYASEKPTNLVKKVRPILTRIEESMEESSGSPVSFRTRIFKSYEKTYTTLASGELDVARLDIAAFLEAQNRSAGITPLAMEAYDKKKRMDGVLFVSRSSPLKTLEEIRGTKLILANEHANSLTLFAQWHLMWNKILASDLGSYGYSNSDIQAVQAVTKGDFDVGVLSKPTFVAMVNQGYPIRELAIFPLPSHVWAARAGLDPGLIADLSMTLKGFDDAPALKKLGPTGFLKAEDKDFDISRKALEYHWIFLLKQPGAPAQAVPPTLDEPQEGHETR